MTQAQTINIRTTRQRYSTYRGHTACRCNLHTVDTKSLFLVITGLISWIFIY